MIDNSNNTIWFLHADVKLDLSGFIKGYVLRAIRRMIFEENIHNGLINMGNSSVLAIGNHPHGQGWKVSISGNEHGNEYVLFNQCLTTSGNKEQTKWPIKKPQTLKEIVSATSLSVITDDPAVGEVLSIALYIANKIDKQLILKQFDESVKLII